jgi:YggT family protein
MERLLGFVFFIAHAVLGLLSVVIIIWAVMSWLVAFNVMNYRHPLIRQLDRFLEAIVRPVLWPLRKVIPTFGGVDITPVIALIIIQGVDKYLIPMA